MMTHWLPIAGRCHDPLPGNESLPTSHFFSGSSFLPLSSGMYGLHGVALIGPAVFQTTLNWPLPCTSPMNTGFCRCWFFSSILMVKPSGALNDCPAIAAITLSTSVDLAFSTACFHMFMPTYAASIGSLVSGFSAPARFLAFAYAAHFFLNSSLAGFLSD